MKSLSQTIKEGLIQPSDLGHKTDGLFKLLNSKVEANRKKKC